MHSDSLAAPLHRADRAVSALAFLALVLPWLNPFAGGPSAAVEPWLISMACALLAWAALALLGQQADGWRRTVIPVILGAWVAAAAVNSVIALLQYFDQARHLGFLVNVSPVGEAYGNLRQRNQMASLTGIGFVALLWWAPRIRGASVIGLIVLLALGNATTASRTGAMQWLGLALLAVLWPGEGRRRRVVWALIALAAYLIATLSLPELLEVATGKTAGSALSRFGGETGCSSRRVLWSNVLYLIGLAPWTGWGWGHLDYAHFMTLYPGTRFCDILDNAHNLPLHLAVELGLPMAGAVCVLVVAWVLRRRPWAERDATRQAAWGVLAVIAVHSLLEYPLWYGPFQIATVLCVLLLWRRPGGAADAGGGTGVAIRAQMALILALMVALAYAAFDYLRVSQLYLAPGERAVLFRENAFEQASRSWLFQEQVRFADLTLSTLSRENAEWTHDLAAELLHFSPEPRVVERLIESAVMLGRDDEALALLARFRAAFPEDHAQWAAAQRASAASVPR